MLAATWQPYLGDEFNKDYLKTLRRFLVDEKAQKKIILPPSNKWFNAFNLTPFDKVKVVILGQDPYHGPKQANGLSFSVNNGLATPPSLRNIFKELKNDLNITNTQTDLSAWAKQGVLLLNSVLTVELHKAASHADKGWEIFTDQAIAQLSKNHQHLVFLLWGSYAQKKITLIDKKRHFILSAPHPSPLSAHRGFFGCRHFSTTNHYLKHHHQCVIDWKLN